MTARRRLAIIPNDPIALYLSSGYSVSWLRDYFNPLGFFDEVYSLSPYEQAGTELVGVTGMPTVAEDLPRRLRDLRIDMVRAYGGSHPCALACRDKVAGIPVVVSVHDALPSMLDVSIADADVVLCVSEVVRRLVQKQFRRRDRVWLLPNRVDFDEMRPFERRETADLTEKYPFRYRILHVGRRVGEKNIENLIRALGLLGPDYCLLTVGKGPAAGYAQLAAEAGVTDRCFFIDAIPHGQLARVLLMGRLQLHAQSI